MSDIVARLGKLWQITLVLGVVAFAYAPSLGTGYFADDFDYAVRYRDGEPFQYSLFRNTDGTGGGGSWRPLTTASLWLTMQVQSPLFDHAKSLALYLILVTLVYLLARGLFPDAGRNAAAALALLIALLPSHVEPVVWVGARADLIAAVFGVAGILAWGRGSRRLALFLLTLSILAKEVWFLVGIVLPLSTARFDRRRIDWKWFVSYLFVCVVWLLLRYAITGYGAGGYSITSEQHVFGVQHLANEIVGFAVGVWSFGEFQSLLIRFSQYYWFIIIWVVGAVGALYATRVLRRESMRLCAFVLCALLGPALLLSVPMITPSASVGEQRYWFAASFFLMLLLGGGVAVWHRRAAVILMLAVSAIFFVGARYNISLFIAAAQQRDMVITSWKSLDAAQIADASVYGLPDTWHGVHLFASPFFERALSFYGLMQPRTVEPWFQWCSDRCASSPARIRSVAHGLLFESNDARIFSATSRGLLYSVTLSRNFATSRLFWTGTEWIFSQATGVENLQKVRY